MLGGVGTLGFTIFRQGSVILLVEQHVPALPRAALSEATRATSTRSPRCCFPVRSPGVTAFAVATITVSVPGDDNAAAAGTDDKKIIAMVVKQEES